MGKPPAAQNISSSNGKTSTRIPVLHQKQLPKTESPDMMKTGSTVFSVKPLTSQGTYIVRTSSSSPLNITSSKSSSSTNPSIVRNALSTNSIVKSRIVQCGAKSVPSSNRQVISKSPKTVLQRKRPVPVEAASAKSEDKVILNPLTRTMANKKTVKSLVSHVPMKRLKTFPLNIAGNVPTNNTINKKSLRIKPQQLFRVKKNLEEDVIDRLDNSSGAVNVEDVPLSIKTTTNEGSQCIVNDKQEPSDSNFITLITIVEKARETCSNVIGKLDRLKNNLKKDKENFPVKYFESYGIIKEQQKALAEISDTLECCTAEVFEMKNYDEKINGLQVALKQNEQIIAELTMSLHSFQNQQKEVLQHSCTDVIKELQEQLAKVKTDYASLVKKEKAQSIKIDNLLKIHQELKEANDRQVNSLTALVKQKELELSRKNKELREQRVKFDKKVLQLNENFEQSSKSQKELVTKMEKKILRLTEEKIKLEKKNNEKNELLEKENSVLKVEKNMLQLKNAGSELQLGELQEKMENITEVKFTNKITEAQEHLNKMFQAIEERRKKRDDTSSPQNGEMNDIKRYVSEARQIIHEAKKLLGEDVDNKTSIVQELQENLTRAIEVYRLSTKSKRSYWSNFRARILRYWERSLL